MNDLLLKALILPSYYHCHMLLILPPKGDLLLGLAGACLLPVLEPSVEPAKHKASSVPAASSLLGQEVAQDNFNPAFGAPELRGYLDLKGQLELDQGHCSTF